MAATRNTKPAPKFATITMDCPAVRVWGKRNADGTRQASADIAQGERLAVKRTFWRGGEGWARLLDGREVPDVFFNPSELYA